MKGVGAFPQMAIIVPGFLLVVGALALSTAPVSGDDRGLVSKSMTLEQLRSERRVALVVGNGTYQGRSFSKLQNPKNDAVDMAKALESFGFEIVRCPNKARGRCLDLTRKEMSRAFQDFGTRLGGGGVGLFYYAGHGMQIGGENYLVPVDASMRTEADADSEAYSIESVLRKIGESPGRLNLVILDACRNNPFESKFRSAPSRSAGIKGLAAVTKGQLPTGTLVAFATSPGSVASDGNGRNGAYTAALLEHMTTPGLRMRDMFDHVRVDVERKTGAKQLPWENAALRPGRFYFTMPDPDQIRTVKGEVVCPEGTTRQGEKCVAKMAAGGCPPGMKFEPKKGCVPLIAKAKCPSGTKFVLRKGCVAKIDRKCPSGTHFVASRGCVPRREERPAPKAEGSKRAPMGTLKGMVRVPAGVFLRGSNHAKMNERPQRSVYLSEFWIDKYEVTVAAYKKCVNAGGCTAVINSPYCNWGKAGRDKYPVNCVTWFQAQDLCRWQGKVLPTEAQWEKAARGPDGREFPWGNQAPSCDRVVMHDETLKGRPSPSPTQLPSNSGLEAGCGSGWNVSVGSKPAGLSPYGAYDMAGNLYEWTADWYSASAYQNSITLNPRGPLVGRPQKGSSHKTRVHRGGCFNDSEHVYFRAANRHWDTPDSTMNYIGIRCAKPMP